MTATSPLIGIAANLDSSLTGTGELDRRSNLSRRLAALLTRLRRRFRMALQLPSSPDAGHGDFAADDSDRAERFDAACHVGQSVLPFISLVTVGLAPKLSFS